VEIGYCHLTIYNLNFDLRLQEQKSLDLGTLIKRQKNSKRNLMMIPIQASVQKNGRDSEMLPSPNHFCVNVRATESIKAYMSSVKIKKKGKEQPFQDASKIFHIKLSHYKK
jgi:hypothetical protein